MGKRTLVLKFPQKLVDQPITYKLVKDYNLKINILQAKVTPKEEGTLVLRIEGPEEKIKEGIGYLEKVEVKVQLLVQDIEVNIDKCTDCTYCVPLCPVQAFSVDRKSMKINLDKEECIACGICVDICPYEAVELKLG